MNREPLQIDEAGGIDVSRLSEQVSKACDVFLRKRGIEIERGTFGRNLKREGREVCRRSKQLDPTANQISAP